MFTFVVLPVFLIACGGSNAATATSADGTAARIAGGFDCATFSDDLIAAYAATEEEGLKPEHKSEIENVCKELLVDPESKPFMGCLAGKKSLDAMAECEKGPDLIMAIGWTVMADEIAAELEEM